jgi:hypothetical protein
LPKKKGGLDSYYFSKNGRKNFENREKQITLLKIAKGDTYAAQTLYMA